MSFNSDLKTELSTASFSCRECIYAECLGMMLYAGKFSSDGIKLTLSNPTLRKRVATVCRQVFGVPFKQDGNTLTLTDEAKDFVISSAYDPIYGARPLKRFVQSKVETLVAREIIGGALLPESELSVVVNEGKLEVKVNNN